MFMSNTLRFRAVDLYLGLICLFPLSTMVVDGTIINKLMFTVLFTLHIVSLFSRPISKRTVVLLLCLIIQYLFVLWHTDFPIYNTNLLFYFPYFLFYTYFMYDNMDVVMEWMSNHKKYIHGIVVIWNIIVGISIFVPSCYYLKEGGELYFGSWVNDIFRLGPSVCFIQVLIIVLQTVHKQKNVITYMLIPLYCVFMGSSRTYLGVSLLLFVVMWYISFRKKANFWTTILPLCAVFFAVLVNSSMWDKILFTLDEGRYGDFWFRITSSRSLLWEKDMAAWNNLPIFNKLLGCDIDLTYNASGRWAHNDFIEILCSFGILGIVEYVMAMYSLIRKSWGQKKVPVILIVCVVFVWLFNAFFNMHYVYLCSMLSYPFLVLALRPVSGKRTEEISQYNK